MKGQITSDKAAIVIGIVVVLLLIAGGFALLSGGMGEINPPANVAAVLEKEKVHLTWDASSSPNVIGYNIYRSTVEGDLGLLVNDAPVDGLEYIDSPTPGVTYYYTVRALSSNGDESQNIDQVEIYVKPMPPTGLSISVNNGDICTPRPDVMLLLHAENAEKCRYSNDGVTWSDWMPYSETKEWTLDSTSDGERTVYYQCERMNSLSDIVSDSITLDTHAPSVTMEVLGIDETNDKIHINVNAVDYDNLDPVLDCSVIERGDVVYSFTSDNPDQYVSLAYGRYPLMVVCYDDCGNYGFAVYQVDYKSNESGEGETEVSLSINDGDYSTESRNVRLYIKSKGVDECRFANEVDYPDDFTAWQPVPSDEWTRTWMLSDGYGMKTVFMECRDDETNETFTTYDLIKYVEESSGGGNGGGSDGSSNGSSNETNESVYANMSVKGKIYDCPSPYSKCVVRESPFIIATPTVEASLSPSGPATEGKIWVGFSTDYSWDVWWVLRGFPGSCGSIVGKTSEDCVDWDPNYGSPTSVYVQVPYSTTFQGDTLMYGYRAVFYKVRGSNGQESNTVRKVLYLDMVPPEPIDPSNINVHVTQISKQVYDIHVSLPFGGDIGSGALKYFVVFCSGKDPNYLAKTECRDIGYDIKTTMAMMPINFVDEKVSILSGNYVKIEVFIQDRAGHISKPSYTIVKLGEEGGGEEEANVTVRDVVIRGDTFPYYDGGGINFRSDVTEVYVSAENADKCRLGFASPSSITRCTFTTDYLPYNPNPPFPHPHDSELMKGGRYNVYEYRFPGKGTYFMCVECANSTTGNSDISFAHEASNENNRVVVIDLTPPTGEIKATPVEVSLPGGHSYWTKRKYVDVEWVADDTLSDVQSGIKYVVIKRQAAPPVTPHPGYYDLWTSQKNMQPELICPHNPSTPWETVDEVHISGHTGLEPIYKGYFDDGDLKDKTCYRYEIIPWDAAGNKGDPVITSWIYIEDVEQQTPFNPNAPGHQTYEQK